MNILRKIFTHIESLEQVWKRRIEKRENSLVFDREKCKVRQSLETSFCIAGLMFSLKDNQSNILMFEIPVTSLKVCKLDRSAKITRTDKQKLVEDYIMRVHINSLPCSRYEKYD